MAHILKTGTKDEMIEELRREVEIARKALSRICDLSFVGEDERMGAPYPEPQGKIIVIARNAIAEMQDDD